MIDIKPMIVNTLEGIGDIPVFYEAFIDSSTATFPCITYKQTTNSDYIVGDTLSYSNIVIQIKVWSKTVDEMETIGQQIDIAMKELGFKREFGDQLFLNGLGQYILRYAAIGYEK